MKPIKVISWLWHSSLGQKLPSSLIANVLLFRISLFYRKNCSQLALRVQCLHLAEPDGKYVPLYERVKVNY